MMEHEYLPEMIIPEKPDAGEEVCAGSAQSQESEEEPCIEPGGSFKKNLEHLPIPAQHEDCEIKCLPTNSACSQNEVLGGGASHDDMVKVSLLCSNTLDLDSQLPDGLRLNTHGQYVSSTQSWYSVAFETTLLEPKQFEQFAEMLLNWFHEAATRDEFAIMGFPPLLSMAQLQYTHTLAARMGLAYISHGPSDGRSLIICSNLHAIKHIPAQWASAPTGRPTPALPADAVSSSRIMASAATQDPSFTAISRDIQSSTSTVSATVLEETRATIKERMYQILLRHPEGLTAQFLTMNYGRTFRKEIPLQVNSFLQNMTQISIMYWH
jgi:hypothetical protein